MYLIVMPINLKNFKNMQDTTVMEFQSHSPMALSKYYIMMRVD